LISFQNKNAENIVEYKENFYDESSNLLR